MPSGRRSILPARHPTNWPGKLAAWPAGLGRWGLSDQGRPAAGREPGDWRPGPGEQGAESKRRRASETVSDLGGTTAGAEGGGVGVRRRRRRGELEADWLVR